MRNESDIFDEYAKLMKNQGLVSEAYGQEFRKDQYDLDAIEVLYGIKPNGKEDDESIIEKAHPETAVVGRSYDAMNAVVENEHERQAINAYIATKMPEGRHTMRRYVRAKEDLMKAVVRAAYTLDNDDETQLMKLADDCAGRIHKKALAPLAIPLAYWLGGAAIAGIGSGAYLFAAAPPVAKNVSMACNIVLMHLPNMGEKPYSKDIHEDVNKLGDLATKFAAVSAKSVEIQNNEDSVVANEQLDQMMGVVSQYAAKASDVFNKIGSWKSQIDQFQSSDKESWGDWLNRQTKGLWDTMFSSLRKNEKFKQYLDLLAEKIVESKSEISRLITFIKGMKNKNEEPLDQGSKVTPIGPARLQKNKPQVQPQPQPESEPEFQFEMAASPKRREIKRRGA